jgi:hypothetical protein
MHGDNFPLPYMFRLRSEVVQCSRSGKLLLGLATTVVLGSGFCGSHDRIFLPHNSGTCEPDPPTALCSSLTMIYVVKYTWNIDWVVFIQWCMKFCTYKTALRTYIKCPVLSFVKICKQILFFTCSRMSACYRGLWPKSDADPIKSGKLIRASSVLKMYCTGDGIWSKWMRFFTIVIFITLEKSCSLVLYISTQLCLFRLNMSCGRGAP